VRGDLPECFIHIRYVDVRPHSAFTGDRRVDDEVADDVAGPVLEARLVKLGVGPPAEDGFVKAAKLRGSLAGIRR
jgi:hypothetical protein